VDGIEGVDCRILIEDVCGVGGLAWRIQSAATSAVADSIIGVGTAEIGVSAVVCFYDLAFVVIAPDPGRGTGEGYASGGDSYALTVVVHGVEIARNGCSVEFLVYFGT